jgi:uroporphyrinogen-III synthase
MSRHTILNTRPSDQAAELTQLLRQAGFVVVEAPAVAILPAWDPTALEAVRRDFDTFGWVVLSSQNAARGLEDRLHHARVVCGAATATALGIVADSALRRFSAAAALQALRTRVRAGQRVLVPRAAEGRDELINGLRALGARVEAPVAYRTVAIADAAERLGRGGIDVVTLCSPSAATSVAPAITNEIVVCLGETTAAAARDAGVRVHAVAATTSMASLVDAIRASLGVRV